MNSSSLLIVFDDQKGNFTTWSYAETPNESNHYPFPDSPRNNYQKVTDWLDVYFLPILILVGLAGNILSVCVFILSHLRRLSSSVYLAALAIADAGFLFCALAEWCGHISSQFHHKNGWCQMLSYLRSVWSFLSVWYVVSFTIERYIAVCHPFQRQKFCTTKRAKAVVLALAVTAAVIYNWRAWTTGPVTTLIPGHSLCAPLHKWDSTVIILEIIDTILTLLIPSVTIMVLNVGIVCAVCTIQRDRRHMSSTHLSNGEANGVRPCTDPAPSTPSNRYTHIGVISSSSTYSHTVNPRRRHNYFQVKVTKMLVLVSTIFLVLNLPSHALRLYAFVQSFLTDTKMPSAQYLFIHRLFQYFNYTNFAINFFLYNTCGRNFRHALRHLGRKIRYNIRHKCFGKKYQEDDIAVVPLKRKHVHAEEDIQPINGQHNMIHRCQSLSHSGSRSLKDSKGSKGGVEMRPTAVQIRSHHSHSSYHSYYSHHSREMSHHSREFSHHSRVGSEFSHHGRGECSHHSRYASPSCSDASTSSCSHRSLHRCKPL